MQTNYFTNCWSCCMYMYGVQSVKPNAYNDVKLNILQNMGCRGPSGLAYRTQVLVLAAECGFESRP